MTDTAIKNAVIDRIKAVVTEKKITPTWLYNAICKVLKVKRTATKTRRVELSKAELEAAIIKEVTAHVKTLGKKGTAKLKDFIKNGGGSSLLETLAAIDTRKTLGEPTQEEVAAAVDKLLGDLDITQCWTLLDTCTTYAAPKEEPKTTSKRQVCGYTTVTDEVAADLIATCYEAVASGSQTITPLCFRSVGLKNATNCFRRLEFSHLNKEACKPEMVNNMVTPALEWYKKNVTTRPLAESTAIINNFLAANPDTITKIKARSKETYIQALLKK
jgi:hypothetical protein